MTGVNNANVKALRVVCVVLAFHLAMAAGEETRKAQIFAGGMAIRSGYLLADNHAGRVTGVGTGVAGRLLFRLGPVFSAGGIGGTLHLGYRDPALGGSYVDAGWGGVVADAGVRLDRLRLSAGLIAGGCGVTNLHITRREADSIGAVFTHQGSWLVAPLLTADVLLTRTISLMVSADCFIARDLDRNGVLLCPALQAGVLFNK